MAYTDDDIIIDFLHDWAEIQRRALRNAGYVPSGDDQAVSFQFFNMLKRLVEPRPRRVYEAKDLVCPPGLEAGYEAVKDKISRGVDLKPHLSRGLTKLDFDDMLVNDWGIYHLHLGTTVEGDGFVDRTGPVLFARFERDDAYLITIQTHGKNAPNVWTNQRMLTTLHENWPAVLEPYAMKGIVATETPVTDDELRRLRRAGVQTSIQVGDAVLFPPGGGYSTAGLAIDVVRKSDWHMAAVRSWEEHLVAKKTEVLETLTLRGITLERPAALRLEVDDKGKASAVTTRSDGSRLVLGLGVGFDD